MRLRAGAIEKRALVHPSPPFHVGVLDELSQMRVGGEAALAISLKGSQWLVKIVEQQVAFIDVTLKGQMQRPCCVADMVPDPG